MPYQLEQEPGKLSPLGEAYVHMPVHDADVYYRIPGQLPAQNYTEFTDMDIMVTKRPEMLVTSTAAGAIAGISGLFATLVLRLAHPRSQPYTSAEALDKLV